jgi:chromosome segregation ATPase
VSAEIILEDIGGLSRAHSLKFIRGAINIVKAPNAAGKSSIIKAIALCLSTPLRSKRAAEIARDMGLLRQPGEAVEPLVHVNANMAKISIKFDNNEWKLSLSKEGDYTYTREGDERFLITSVLTRSSVIFNKLLRGDVNFKWIIEELSLASRYEVAVRVVEKKLNEMIDLLEGIKRKREEIESLKRKSAELKEEINNCRREESELNAKLSELLKGHPEIDKLREQRDQLITKIKEQDNKIKEINERIKKIKKEIDELNKRYEMELSEKESLEKKEKELIEVITLLENRLSKLDKRLENYEKRLNDINEQIEKLRIEEGRFLAKKEIYEEALKLTPQLGKVICFLCEQGYLTIDKLIQAKSSVESQLNNIRNRISDLISEKNRIYSELKEREELKKKLDQFKAQRREITQKLQIIDRSLSIYFEEVKSLHENLSKFEEKLKEEEQLLTKYRTELEAIDESIRAIGEEEQKIIENIALVRGRLKEAEKQLISLEKEIESASYVEILGRRFLLDNAEKILNIWIAVLEEVLKHLDTEARKERVMVAELFNEQVKKILWEFKFEYLDVWIDANHYKLHIVDKRVGREVSPRILSETERCVLAFIIHMALKLTYTPHIPFFLIDEVALSFDEIRKKAVLKYLSELAKENGWFIILTELGREPRIIVDVLTNP